MANNTPLTQGSPAVPFAQIADKSGNVTGIWYSFFVNLWQRTGGATASLSPLLDAIINIPGSLLVRGASLWQGLGPGNEFQVLRLGEQLPEWDFLDGNSFESQASNEFFAGPAAGASANPVFRKIATEDLAPIAGEIPGTETGDNAAAGNVGEYLSATGTAAPASGTAINIVSLPLTAGDWDVWGNISTSPAGGTIQTDIKAWISITSATDPAAPNAGAYTELDLALGSGQNVTLPVGMKRVSLAAAGTIYLSTTITFSTSTMNASGFLGARRAR